MIFVPVVDQLCIDILKRSPHFFLFNNSFDVLQITLIYHLFCTYLFLQLYNQKIYKDNKFIIVITWSTILLNSFEKNDQNTYLQDSDNAYRVIRKVLWSKRNANLKGHQNGCIRAWSKSRKSCKWQTNIIHDVNIKKIWWKSFNVIRKLDNTV